MADHGYLDVVLNRSEFGPDDVLYDYTINGSTSKAGHVVTAVGETYPDCALGVAADSAFLGIIRKPIDITSWTNLDTAIAENSPLEIIRPTGGRLKIAVYYMASGNTRKEGEPVSMASEGGKVIDTEGLYTDTAYDTDPPIVVGHLAHDVVQDNTNDQVVLIWF